MASFLAPSLFISLIIVSASNTIAAPSASVVVNGDITTTVQEMQRARYFTFVMLIRMVQEKIPQNTTFLMPNDRMLSTASIPENQVLEFLSRHSIPAPLMFDDLIRLPNGTTVPTGHSCQTITITNMEHQKLYFNNVELTSPDVCHVGDLFRCHGINGVIRPIVPRGKGTACPGHVVPTAAPAPASVANQSLETSSLTSSNMGSASATSSMQPAAESPQSSDTSTSQIAFSCIKLILVLIFSIF
ncbi:FAS1 domain-containing protein SELMODRAFT_448915-like [Oryza brachyantha]|uniref:FAS1 domain-containing protein SELMODRAFT_448915-like n=1 Tax=Oryza brachyantha TaxID=4533 RepID=UPI0007761B4B|nr:FAS1 domain-containing protein SELMODRAFT_448915-like [Oryza brachyantha]